MVPVGSQGHGPATQSIAQLHTFSDWNQVMNFDLLKGTVSQAKADVAVIGFFKGEDPAKVLKSLDAKLDGKFLEMLKQHVSAEGFKGKIGEFVSLPTFGNMSAARMILAGLGARDEFTPDATRKICANLSRRVKPNGKNVKVVLFVRKPDKALKAAGKTRSAAQSARSAKQTAKGSGKQAPGIEAAGKVGTDVEHVKAGVEGWILGKFDFDKYKASKNGNAASNSENGENAGTARGAAKAGKGKLNVSLAFAGLTIDQKTFAQVCRQSLSIAEATNFARALIAEPPSFMTPTRLSIEAKNIAKASGMVCTVYSTEQIKKMGMGSFLGVAQGADEPPKFIVIKYTARKSKKTVAIVGKGITFDSGGLSIKPAQSMERMKYDMSGAAAVLATMRVVGELKPNVSVLALVAATENMPSGKALHPGDVLKAMNGKTIEVNNTDAEGRLVLADALTYAVQHKADELIDIATLTGAVVQALGRAAAGIMGTDPGLIYRITEAGLASGEKFWQLPLFDEYKSALASDIADLINAGSRGEAGSSCAGMFLKEFAGGKPWVHLDIAGVAWSEKNKDEINKGGTGFGVRTLSNYLLSQ